MKTKNALPQRLARFAFTAAFVYLALVCCSWAGLVETAEAATYTVTNTNDSGSGSLRNAISNANSTSGPGFDTIVFNIPFSGFQTIKPLSPLPTITAPVVIDGYTQPGAKANTLAVGDNAVILIELNGSLAGPDPNAFGLVIQSETVTIRGLAINRFKTAGIYVIVGLNTFIEGNYVGLDITGTGAPGDQGRGIQLLNGVNVTIGGAAAAARNIISGNYSHGIELKGESNGNFILGNYIGTAKSGNTALGNQEGIDMAGASNIIGSTEPHAGNVISGNNNHGIVTSSAAAAGNIIVGNFIGTNSTGTSPLGNGGEGISISASNNIIGGTTPETRNIISANGSTGITIRGFPPFVPSGNVVQGNYIGTDVTGTWFMGNEWFGIAVMGHNVIGGDEESAGNLKSLQPKERHIG